MKITYRLEGATELRKAIEALPVGLQHACYGAGFRKAASGVAKRARAAAPVGEGPAYRKGRKGLREKRLFESISVKLIPWHWGGHKVPKSAGIVVARQPHAWLVEHGVRGPHRSRSPQPYLWPAMQETSTISSDFGNGCRTQFRRVVEQIRRGKLSKATARALKLGGGG